MKGLLILFNLFLASMLVWGLASHFKPAASKTVYTVKKRTASQKKEVVAPVKPVAVQKKMTPKEQLAKIIEANIFNSDRCPNATAGGGMPVSNCRLSAHSKSGTVSEPSSNRKHPGTITITASCLSCRGCPEVFRRDARWGSAAITGPRIMAVVRVEPPEAQACREE